MRHILFKTTLVAGLVTSLASVAVTDLDSCLAENSGKNDKMTICLDQVHQSMADARKQELKKQYDDSLAELNKQQEELAKKQRAAGGAAASGPTSSAATGGPTNTGPSLPVNQPATTPTNSENAPNITTTPTTTGNAASTTPTPTDQNGSKPTDESSSTPPEKKGVDVRPVPREKPKGVQWY